MTRAEVDEKLNAARQIAFGASLREGTLVVLDALFAVLDYVDEKLRKEDMVPETPEDRHARIFS